MPQDAAPFRVVLTGGIASGKTAVAKEFEALGVPVIDTDQISRDVVEPGSQTLAQIVATFGAIAVDSRGRYDRRRIRELVFADPEERKKLNAIIHPAIRAELARRSQTAGGPYQMHAIPLFVDTGAQGGYDRVLVVDCSEQLQLQRLLQRDKLDEAQAHQILAAQATREQRLAVANDVIVNDDTLAKLRNHAAQLHQRYLELAAAKAARQPRIDSD
jgi:dephospho-CoA kinase